MSGSRSGLRMSFWVRMVIQNHVLPLFYPNVAMLPHLSAAPFPGDDHDDDRYTHRSRTSLESLEASSEYRVASSSSPSSSTLQMGGEGGGGGGGAEGKGGEGGDVGDGSEGGDERSDGGEGGKVSDRWDVAASIIIGSEVKDGVHDLVNHLAGGVEMAAKDGTTSGEQQQQQQQQSGLGGGVGGGEFTPPSRVQKLFVWWFCTQVHGVCRDSRDVLITAEVCRLAARLPASSKVGNNESLKEAAVLWCLVLSCVVCVVASLPASSKVKGGEKI